MTQIDSGIPLNCGWCEYEFEDESEVHLLRAEPYEHVAYVLCASCMSVVYGLSSPSD